MTGRSDNGGGGSPANRRTEGDRRDTGLRRVKVVLSGKLLAENLAHRLVVTNISSTGLAGRTGARFRKGDRLEISLGGTELIPASVVWTSEDRLGLRFDSAIHLDNHLAPGVSSEELYAELDRRAARIAQLDLERSGRLAPRMRNR